MKTKAISERWTYYDPDTQNTMCKTKEYNMGLSVIIFDIVCWYHKHKTFKEKFTIENGAMAIDIVRNLIDWYQPKYVR